MRKKKILIDLDVITVGIWKKRDSRREIGKIRFANFCLQKFPKEIFPIAKRFIQRVENKEFEVVTPYILLDLVYKWDNIVLREDIRKFYFENTSSFVERTGVITQIGRVFEEVFTELEDKGIKDEDVFLILTTSAKKLDYLVTFNRKHLKSKGKIVNEILAKHGLKTIMIGLPNEIQSSSSSTFDNLSK